jgi:hypothetical protein
MDSVTGESVGDLATLLPSFQRLLRAANKSPKTCATYAEAGNQLLAFLIESSMPTPRARSAGSTSGRSLSGRSRQKAPATANNRYTLQSVAYDSAGRKSQSKGVTITLNN